MNDSHKTFILGTLRLQILKPCVLPTRPCGPLSIGLPPEIFFRGDPPPEVDIQNLIGDLRELLGKYGLETDISESR